MRVFCGCEIIYQHWCFTRDNTEKLNTKLMVVDVSNLKNDRKPVKLQKENPVGCAGEGKQSKGN